MPIPIIVAAIAAGGTLVPHAAGGFIVTSATGYVAGTYLSTAAISAILATSAGILTTGAVIVTGAASAVVGGAGIFGTTMGASGVIGALMSAGLISSTPIWVPIAIGGTALVSSGTLSYAAYTLVQMRRKAAGTAKGEEAHFSEAQAKLMQRVLLRINRDAKGDSLTAN